MLTIVARPQHNYGLDAPSLVTAARARNQTPSIHCRT